MNASHIILTKKQPGLKRGWLTPGGKVTTCVGLVLSVIAVCSTFFVDTIASIGIICVLIAGSAYFFIYAKKRLIANAPEEEFAKLEDASAEIR